MNAPPEGQIRVGVSLEGGRVRKVDIQPRRLLPAKAVLGAKTVPEALGTLPHIFSLCGTAQLQAGLAAVENASNIVADPPQVAARRLLLLAEMVQEHGSRLLLDVPKQAGQAPDLPAVRDLRRLIASLKPLISPAAQWGVPGGVELAPDRLALEGWAKSLRDWSRKALFDAADAAAWTRPEAVKAWARDRRTAPARLIDHLERKGLSSFGRADSPLLDSWDEEDLKARMRADASGAYLAKPDLQGAVFETGPLSRQAANPLIAKLIERQGKGLLARIIARLLEAALAVRDIETLIPALESHAPSPVPPCHGVGMGIVEAARGRLVHVVEIDDGITADWKILAPTEWNFHPEGPFARALGGVKAGEAQALAHLLASAIDPCVDIAIEVRGHA
jgi:coenzyme F420-reducing hydrogenase alpha subunit